MNASSYCVVIAFLSSCGFECKVNRLKASWTSMVCALTTLNGTAEDKGH